MGRLVQPHSDRPTQEPKVGQMLELHKRRAQAPEGSAERAEVERRIQQVDREIDELGYELYGVTEKELQSIESKSWEGSGMTERGESSQHQPWEAVGAFVGNHSQADCEYNRSVSLGPIDPALLKSALDKGLRLRKAQGFAGIWGRPRIERVMAMRDQVKLVKVKAHPESKDLNRLLEAERLFLQTPEWERHRHKPPRKFLICAEETPEAMRQAKTQSVTVYPFRPGRFHRAVRANRSYVPDWRAGVWNYNVAEKIWKTTERN